MNRNIVAGCLLFLLVLLTGCSLASEPIPAGPIQSGPLPEAEVPVPVSLPDVSNGAVIFQERCASCHGEEGTGDGEKAAQVMEQGGLLPNLSDPDLARLRSPQDWYDTITNGRVQALMPPWRDELTNAQRWDVTYFLYSLSTPETILADGETIYTEHCSECHGVRGDQAGLNDLGSMGELSAQNIFDAFVTDGGDDIHEFADTLTEDERWAVALYAQALSYNRPLDLAEAPPVPAAEEEIVPEEEIAAEEETEEVPEGEEETAIELETPVLTGVVQGTVVNGSPGNEVPTDLEIELRGLTIDQFNNFSAFVSQTTTIGADGTFRFEDVPVDVDNAAYVVTTIYDGVEFGNASLVAAGTPEIDLPITIYEHTTNAGVISVDAMHLVILEHPDSLLVTQVYVFSNTSDRIYVTDEPVLGGRRGSVSIYIPPEAYGIQFEDGQLGGRFVAGPDVIYDTRQVLPGQQSHNVIVNYFLPLDGSREISIPVIYQTNRITVLLQGDQKLRSEMLSPAGSEVIGGQAYNQYVGQSLSPGSILTFRLQSSALGRNVVPLVLSVLLVVVLVGGIALIIIHSRQSPAQPVSSGLTRAQQHIIVQVAELDEAFEAGKIDRFTYEARRAELKAAITEISQ